MNLIEERILFEKNKIVYEQAVLKFKGVDGYDVYNTSIPFAFKGKNYLFGRVERRNEWARSWVRLFEQIGVDEYSLVPDSMIYQLEDPYVSFIDNMLVLGGTHVCYNKNEISTYYGYFYKGTDINDLYYFTTGPDYMKDIRLVQLSDKRVGVFSRHRNDKILKKHGSEAMIGFSIIDGLNDLSAEVIENAPLIEGLFGNEEWGGCNQCYALDSGLIGVIGHKSHNSEVKEVGQNILTYLNISFVFDPIAFKVMDLKIIGSRSCYPDGPSKKPDLIDCAFTSGIVVIDDRKVHLYSGIGDVQEGRITIDNPFLGFGNIVVDKKINQKI